MKLRNVSERTVAVYRSYLRNYIAISLKGRFLLCNNSGGTLRAPQQMRRPTSETARFNFVVSVIYSRNETFDSISAGEIVKGVRIYRIILERVSSVR